MSAGTLAGNLTRVIKMTRIFDREKTMEGYKILSRYGPTKKGTWIGWIEYMIQDISIHIYIYLYVYIYIYILIFNKVHHISPFISP